jgi:hypothetical protein
VKKYPPWKGCGCGAGGLDGCAANFLTAILERGNLEPMALVLNSKQAEELAKFLLDVAKGAVLGTLGFSAGVAGLPPATRTAYLVAGMSLAYGCVRTALFLLKE